MRVLFFCERSSQKNNTLILLRKYTGIIFKMIRKILVLLLVLSGGGMVGSTFIPVDYDEVSISLQASRSPSDLVAQPLLRREVLLRMPRELVEGEALRFEMTLFPPVDGDGEISKTNMIEANLDLTGVETFPDPALRTSYRPGQTISFRWLVTAGQSDPLPGTLRLDTPVTTPEGKQINLLVLARPIELTVRHGTGLMRGLGAGIAGLGLILSLFFWIRSKI
jgi:hypothetical protein